MRRGQVSIEYLLLVTVIMTLIIPATYLIANTTQRRASALITESSLDKIEVTSKRVFLKGYPETEVILISLPDNLNPKQTFVANNSVQISYFTSKGNNLSSVRLFNFDASGAFPKKGGRYILKISAKPGGGVALSYFKFLVEPLEINATLDQWSSAIAILNISNVNPDNLNNITFEITGLEGVLAFDNLTRKLVIEELQKDDSEIVYLNINSNVIEGYHYGEISISEEERFLVIPVTIYVKYVDLYPPIISKLKPSGFQHLTTLNLSATTDEIAVCRYSSNDESYWIMPSEFSQTNSTYHAQEVSGLNDGGHTYYVRCSDPLNNTNNESAVINFEINSTIPQITFESPLNQTYYEAEVWTNISVSKQCVWCYRQLDSGMNYTLNNDTATHFYGSIATFNGTHNTTVHCSDFYGNINSSTSHFTVDLSDYENPVITSYNATPYPLTEGAENYVVLYASAMDNTGLNNVTFSILHQNGTWENQTLNMVGTNDSESYDTTIETQGNYTYVIIVKDESGNQASAEGNFFVITDWWNGSWTYRVLVNVSTGSYARNDELVEARIDFHALLREGEILDSDSIRIFDNVTEVPYQYNGTLTWLLDGPNPPGSVRSFYVYFDSTRNPKEPPDYPSMVRMLEQTESVAVQYLIDDDWEKVATIDKTRGVVQSDWFDSKAGLTELRTPNELHVFQSNKDYFQAWSYYKIASPYIYYIPKDLTFSKINDSAVYSAELELHYTGNTTDVGNFVFRWVFYYNLAKAVAYNYQNWTVFSEIRPDHGGCNCDWPKQPGFCMQKHIDSTCFYNSSGLQVATNEISASKPITEYWASYNYTDNQAGSLVHVTSADDMTQGYELGVYERDNLQFFNTAWREVMPAGNHSTVFNIQAIEDITCEKAREEYLKNKNPAVITLGGVESR